MHVVICLIVTASALGTQTSAQTVSDSAIPTPLAFDLTAKATVQVLPPQLREFFSAHFDEFCKSCRLTGSNSPIISTIGSRNTADLYVMLDANATSNDTTACIEAARKFPHEREQARKISTAAGLHEPGRLPWCILEHYEALVTAFRSQESKQVLIHAGALTHLCTYAAMPFQTTRDPSGGRSGGVRWNAHAHMADYQHSTPAMRCQRMLTSRMHSRLDQEVRLSPTRLGRTLNQRDAVFATLLRSHRALHLLLATDRQLCDELGLSSKKLFLDDSGLYYARMEEEAGWIIESRIEDGALLAARLVDSAWAEVGRPKPAQFVKTIEGEITPDDLSTDAAANTEHEKESQNGKFVASRSSKTYHLETCYHVARIKPENCVKFENADKAEATGRQPCKSCLDHDRKDD